MNKKIKWVLVIIWMGIIFWFSNQPAIISDEKSRYVIHLFELLGLNLDSILGDLANFIVRKIGHFTEYFILCMLILNALMDEYNLKRSIMLSIIIVFLYACSDEIHQYFIPGRTARIRDVIIDTSGGIFALIIICINEKINKKRSSKL